MDPSIESHCACFVLDIYQFDHCKFFEEQGGFDKLEKFVDGKIERHQKLVTIIKQNIDAWKNQTTQYRAIVKNVNQWVPTLCLI